MKYNKPVNNEIGYLQLSDFTNYKLDNGIEVYELNFPDTAEVIKIDAVFNAGRLYEKQRLSSKVCAALLKEGTHNFNAKNIAETLDFYGAYLETRSSMDYSRISMLSLNKHFDQLSPLLTEIIFKPSFAQDEFELYKRRSIENLKNQLSKNDVVGYRELTEILFDSSHPYGYNSIEEDFLKVVMKDIEEHHQSFFTTDNCRLFISGNINTGLRNNIMDTFSSIKTNKRSGNINPLPSVNAKSNKYRIPGKQSVQKAIYIGGRLFGRHHPDYIGVLVLSTILGGYFSSRLNSRIREKEALTYGIDAQLDIMREDGFFFISTEVNNENEKPVVNAVYEELDLLRNVLVSDVELNNVKRYIKGQILTSLDGPFKQTKVLQSMIINDVDPLKFTDRVELINKITARDIMRLANKYFHKDNLFEVVVDGNH